MSLCIPGEFTINPNAESREEGCRPCEPGYYSYTGQERQCSACPEGATSLPPRNDISTCVCDYGKYLISDDAGCDICPAGTYQDTQISIYGIPGIQACKPCPFGYESSPGSRQCSQIPISTCPVGMYVENGECVQCPIGTYQPETLPYTNKDGITACQPCGQYKTTSGPGAARCDRCKKGMYVSNIATGECSPCPASFFQPREIPDTNTLGETICETCKNMMTTLSTGSESCDACPTGYYYNSSLGGCVSCPVGKFQNQLLPILSGKGCDSCPNNKTTSTAAATTCDSCPVGTYYDSATDSCIPCSVDTFQDKIILLPNSEGSAVCRPCENGRGTLNTGSSSCDACQPGTYVSSTKDCMPCFQGRYNNEKLPLTNNELSNVCKSCTNNKTTLSEGGTSCNACKPGTSYDVTRDSCVDCPQDTYLGTSLPLGTSCISCLPEKRTFSDGSFSCNACPPGTYVDTNGSCQPVPKGTFRNTLVSINDTGPETALPCPKNSTTDGSGATSLDSCYCDKGYYIKTNRDNTLECAKCPANTSQTEKIYYNMENINKENTICSSCTGGRITLYENSVECDGCPPGTSFDGEKCVPCPENTFQQFKHEYNRQCSPCLGGKVTFGTGSTSCDYCPPGTSYNGQECIPCTAGKYQDKKTLVLNLEECQKCPDGYTSSVGSTSCFKIPIDTDTGTGTETQSTKNQGQNVGTIIGIVVGIILLLSLLYFIFSRYRGKRFRS